ncbi:MAG: RNase H family protein [Pseudobdellovibrionaceae bacterium]
MTALKDENRIIIYTDGACSGNPGIGGWAFVLFDGQTTIYESASFDPQTTNNRMEMSGVIFAFHALQKLSAAGLSMGPIHVHSDSSYVIQGITTWIFGWKKRGWKNLEGKDIANQSLWTQLDEAVAPFRKQIQWIHVPGHAGIPGNERCDELSVKAMREKIEIQTMSLKSEYEFDIFSPVELAKFKKIDPYYLSLVNGALKKHATWSECEATVKGRTGVKFKKIKSLNEEVQVLKDWGISSE